MLYPPNVQINGARDTSPGAKYTDQSEMLMALGHQHGKTLCLDDIKNSLNTDSFWTSYTVEYSPGDGHCFLHSVKSSLKSQWGTEVSIDILLRLIRHETIINRIDYIPVINGNNVYNLTKGLSDYTERKIYDSWYGDIVPTITANALDIKLIVIEKLESCFRCYSVGKNAHNATCLPLLLFKCGKHYDALVSMHGRDYFCLGNEGFSLYCWRTWCRRCLPWRH